MGFDNAAWRATFVTSADLLRDAADALDNDPSTDKQAEMMHPEDAYARAAIVLETVAGLRVAATNRAAGR